VSVAVVKSLLEDGWLNHCRDMGEYFLGRLRDLQKKHPTVQQVRGLGLIVGLELDRPGAPIVDACTQRGFLINCVQDKTLRFVPPLIVGRQEIDLLVETLDRVVDL
jgi:acetylornithine aminotransferase